MLGVRFLIGASTGILLGLFALSEASANGLWSEKPANAPALVELPSLQPIINNLDTTIVNISTTAERPEPPVNPGPPPGSPFMGPQDFFERFFGNPSPQPRRSMGSGFLISEDGFILTNNHVIEGASKIEVRVAEGSGKVVSPENQEVYVAEVIGRDPRTDIALIKIKPKQKLNFAYLGDSDRMRKGDWVVAMGNPFGLEHSVSIGIISAKGREISPNENRRFDDFIQTDAAINFGNSGGPLINLKGEVIGINTAITAQGSGIGFAVSINLVKEILPQLKKDGAVKRGYLGVAIQDVTPEIQQALGLPSAEGVLINDAVKGGPADKILQAGDVITKVERSSVRDARELQQAIGRRKPGESVRLELIRDGRVVKVAVKLGSLDEGAPSSPQQPSDRSDKLGLMVKPHPEESAMMIQSVSPNSSAEEAGLMPGDLLLEARYQSKAYPLNDLKNYERLLKKAKAGSSILFSVQRMQPTGDKVSVFVAVKVPDDN